MTQKYNVWLRWWLFFCLVCLFGIALLHFNIYNLVYKSDITYLSFMIYTLFIGFTIRIGRQTYKCCKDSVVCDLDLNYFIADIMPALGLIGTLVGFIYTFSTDITLSTQDPQQLLVTLSKGMGTALYTTASGLICSLFLRIQIFNLSQYMEKSCKDTAMTAM